MPSIRLFAFSISLCLSLLTRASSCSSLISSSSTSSTSSSSSSCYSLPVEADISNQNAHLRSTFCDGKFAVLILSAVLLCLADEKHLSSSSSSSSSSLKEERIRVLYRRRRREEGKKSSTSSLNACAPMIMFLVRHSSRHDDFECK